MSGGETELAWEATLRSLGGQVREARVDHEAFARPMRLCELARCRATCCHDGVVLGNEEAGEIRRVTAEHRRIFGAFGWGGGEGDPVVETADGKLRTATRAADPGELAADFPAHFPKTRCVFLDPGHRCVLQRLATDTGKHPWFWKPVSCWMHPVLMKSGQRGERPLLTVLGPEQDSLRFASCTPCGRPEPGGDPAAIVLEPELKMLGALGERDLPREILQGRSGTGRKT